MKKKSLNLLGLLLLFIGTLAFTGCSNDDDESIGGNAKCVGAWSKVLKEDLDENGNVTYSFRYDSMEKIDVFEKDGTGYSLEKEYNGSYYNGKGTDNYQWKASGSTFSIDWGDDDGWESYKIVELTDTRMVLQFNGSEKYPDERFRQTWERVDISGIVVGN